MTLPTNDTIARQYMDNLKTLNPNVRLAGICYPSTTGVAYGRIIIFGLDATQTSITLNKGTYDYTGIEWNRAIYSKTHITGLHDNATYFKSIGVTLV